MTTPFTRAPHRGGPVGVDAPNAALLIDFDNVTMGMRSDLSRDLRQLLESDIIKGKVTVQRAYADWRRYPQYIVPLSENSIDLIFAPAYGSSKKNATDIRMAIDAMELVFVRPEIGTFILLTGDSDFSSCVLKLKEYGKYVIGVGIQESSSDILVQNCDEYYSYTGLTGLSKSTGGDRRSVDPWVLVEEAIKKMAERGDVMRSDRLKQVMIELDPSFDEGGYGFSKFSRFITEAASKNLVQLRKLENGQYEVMPSTEHDAPSRRAPRSDEGRPRSRDRHERGRGRHDERRQRPEEGAEAAATPDAGSRRGEARARVQEKAEAPAATGAGARQAPATEAADPLRAGYALLTRALEALKQDHRHPVRDSDVKRRMLELDSGFDESELGFGKFSRFLRQAQDHEIVDLRQQDGGNYEVALPGEMPSTPAGTADDAEDAPGTDAEPTAQAPVSDRDLFARGDVRAQGRAERSRDVSGGGSGRPGARPGQGPREDGFMVRELLPEDVIQPDAPGRRLGPRGGTTRRRSDDGPPSLFEGQGTPAAAATPGQDRSSPSAGPTAGSLDVAGLGLPKDPEAQIRYLTNSYKGVGKKTAERLVEEFGEDLFEVLHTQPERVVGVLAHGRGERVIEAWSEDLRRRQATGATERAPAEADGRARRGGRHGRRPRGGSR